MKYDASMRCSDASMRCSDVIYEAMKHSNWLKGEGKGVRSFMHHINCEEKYLSNHVGVVVVMLLVVVVLLVVIVLMAVVVVVMVDVVCVYVGGSMNAYSK